MLLFEMARHHARRAHEWAATSRHWTRRWHLLCTLMLAPRFYARRFLLPQIRQAWMAFLRWFAVPADK